MYSNAEILAEVNEDLKNEVLTGDDLIQVLYASQGCEGCGCFERQIVKDWFYSDVEMIKRRYFISGREWFRYQLAKKRLTTVKVSDFVQSLSE